MKLFAHLVSWSIDFVACDGAKGKALRILTDLLRIEWNIRTWVFSLPRAFCYLMI
ncbi:hypothetical protein SynBIOSU31_03051 [Synechococcus sp. BIOS-U3-1]|nr:hypothetical protein SynBIOSU31_03051 [Synechococcus sp. BIOS-U3-1]